MSLVAAAQTLGNATPSVPVQNPPAADMMRAYAALGLSYPNQATQQIRPPGQGTAHMATYQCKHTKFPTLTFCSPTCSTIFIYHLFSHLISYILGAVQKTLLGLRLLGGTQILYCLTEGWHPNFAKPIVKKKKNVLNRVMKNMEGMGVGYTQISLILYGGGTFMIKKGFSQ